MQTFIKDPNAVLDYKIDYRADPPGPYLATGENLTASTWTVPAGIVKDLDLFSADDATIWLSSGVVDADYPIENRVETDAGRKDVRTIVVKVRRT